MNSPITIKQLHDDCARAIRNGNGNKHVFITSDDEGNSYHALWYGILDEEKDVDDTINLYHIPVDNYDPIDISKTALLG